MISLIAALSKNGVIGKENALPWNVPEDLKRFRAITKGKTVLMGRKTFESILSYRSAPLPDRKNVVITRDANYKVPEGVDVHISVDEAFAHHQDKEVMVIGGGQIFEQTIDRADKLYLTHVDQVVEGDVYFPAIDPKVWREIEREDHEGYSFVTYIRNS